MTKFECCAYRAPKKCKHPKIKDQPQFDLNPKVPCGECLYREIKIKCKK